MSKTLKQKAWDWCSKYIRLRDAIEFCNRRGIDIGQMVRPDDILGECCTCGAIKVWKYMDAGHWKGRGLGGGSGTYFDERNINLQCKICNGFRGGMAKEHEEYIREKYGQVVVCELERKHYSRLDMQDIAMLAMEIFYKRKYKDLITLFKGA